MKKAIFSVVALLIVFSIIEAALLLSGFSYENKEEKHRKNQWAYRGVQQDPTLPWSWYPIAGGTGHFDSAMLFHFNRLGFRGPDFDARKPAGTIRIASLGDSCTLGWAVEEAQSYCRVLEALLQRRMSKNVQVVNAGVLGFTSYQGLNHLRQRVLRLRPDIITISFNWNDHTVAIATGNGLESPELPLALGRPDKDLPHATAAYWLYSRLRLLRSFQVVEWALSRWTVPARPKAVNRNPEAVPARVPLADYRANILEMIHLARSNKITPVLMSQPYHKDGAEYPAARLFEERQRLYNQTLIEVARAENVTVVDPCPAFDEQAAAGKDLFTSVVHTTPEGNAIIARQLARVIARLPLSR